jgi:hypothetical protein
MKISTPPTAALMTAKEAEEWCARRLIEWLRSSPRKDAVIAFTAGPMRDLAREIEWALYLESRCYE